MASELQGRWIISLLERWRDADGWPPVSEVPHLELLDTVGSDSWTIPLDIVTQLGGFVALPQASSRVSTPSKGALDITGDFEIITNCRITAGNDVARKMVAKDSSVNWTTHAYSFGFHHTFGQPLWVSWSHAADDWNEAVSTAGLPAGAFGNFYWYRVTVDVDAGGGNHEVRFYTSADSRLTPVEDVVWTQLGSTVTAAGDEGVWTTSSALTIGTNSTGGEFSAPWIGDVSCVFLYDGIGGTLVASPDFRDVDAGWDNPPGTDSEGNVWTPAGTGTVWGDRLPIVDKVVVVGGGGSAGTGGSSAPGGGGGGEIQEVNDHLLPSSSAVPYQVGVGGTGGRDSNTPPQPGGNSVFGSITAIRGGVGATNVTNNPSQANRNGGSGGGGSNVNGPAVQGDPGLKTGTGLGNNGGGTALTPDNGGGGGAMAPGQTGTSNTIGGNGGIGKDYSDVIVQYGGDPSVVGDDGYFAGGGGAGAATPGVGGKGGGGNGENDTTHTAASNGMPGTGGGAGGRRGNTTSADYGDGGSGAILIFYRTK